MPKITALEIENFQSIKDRIRIEFASITLLYGPNSAGKSAVFDALDLIECIWDPIKFDQHVAEQMVARWARREGDKKLPIYLAIEFEYRVEDSFTEDIWSENSNWNCKKTRTELTSFFISADNFEDDPEQFERYKDTTVRLEIQITGIEGDKKVEIPALSYIKISISEETLFRYGRLISAADETLADEEIESLMYLRWQGREAIVSRNSPFHSIEIGLLPKQSDGLNNHIKDSFWWFDLCIPSLNLFDVSSISNLRESTTVSAASLLFRDNVSDIFFYFGSLIGNVYRCSTPLVKADRRVPTPEEALFVIDFKHDGWWNSTDSFSASSPAKLFSEQTQYKDPHYVLIAKSSHAALVNKASNDTSWGDSNCEKYISGSTLIKSLTGNLNRVNEHLESHLFREKLYRVECSSTLMVPLDLDQDDDVGGYYLLAQPALVRLYLRDGEGRKLELQDVGSGIPFVLPVLYSAVDGTLSRMQQPELHLHPALQADLADVFLSESRKDKKRLFLIETHSEHLLLRFLRRIRDTGRGLQSDDMLPMNPDDIAIYYFDPQITGGTHAIKQVVTPLGDFYHDWPRGFFADRDKDLFE